MSVITHDDCQGPDGQGRAKYKCIVCKHEICQYPFIHWSADFCICGDCCRTIKLGLMADLIQITAIMDIQSLTRDYRNQTLVRRRTDELEAEAKEDHRTREGPEQHEMIRQLFKQE